MMSTSLSSQQDPRPGRLSPTKGEGGTAASSMPFVSISRCAPLKSPFFRGSRLGFPSGSLAVCSVLGMCCTRFCLPPPNQQASLRSKVTAPGLRTKALAPDRPWEPLGIGDLRTRRLHHSPISFLPSPNCRLQFARRRPNHPSSRNTFLLPSCGVRRTTVFCASHPSYEVVWWSAESGPQPAPSCRLRRERSLSRRFGPHSSTTTPFTPPPGRPLSGPLRTLKPCKGARRRGGGEDDAILSDPHQASLLFPSGYAVHPICFCLSLLLRCPCREACPDE